MGQGVGGMVRGRRTESGMEGEEGAALCSPRPVLVRTGPVLVRTGAVLLKPGSLLVKTGPRDGDGSEKTPK